VEEAVEAGQSGDERARGALEQAGRALGIALANAVLRSRPSGSSSAAASQEPVTCCSTRSATSCASGCALRRSSKSTSCRLGAGAGAIGAALWAAECA
jgi:predicted NBD/HSP70 family sugar kinase